MLRQLTYQIMKINMCVANGCGRDVVEMLARCWRNHRYGPVLREPQRKWLQHWCEYGRAFASGTVLHCHPLSGYSCNTVMGRCWSVDCGPATRWLVTVSTHDIGADIRKSVVRPSSVGVFAPAGSAPSAISVDIATAGATDERSADIVSDIDIAVMVGLRPRR